MEAPIWLSNKDFHQLCVDTRCSQDTEDLPGVMDDEKESNSMLSVRLDDNDDEGIVNSDEDDE